MKKLIVCLMLSVFIVSVKAQDRIITSNKDTIHCKIVTIGTTKILYEQTEGQKIVGKYIHLDDVAGYYRDAKSTVNISNTVYVKKQKKQRIAPEHRWVLGVSVGGSYLPWLLETLPDNDKAGDYQFLKNGFQLSTSFHYLTSNSMGIGLQYSILGSMYNGDRIQVLNQAYPIYITGNSKESQYINYVGPSLLFQQFIGSKHKFQLSETLSGGLLSYRNEEQFSVDMFTGSNYATNSYNILGNGICIGGNFGISAEYYVLPFMSVGLGGSFLYSKLKKISIDYKDSEGKTQKISNQELPQHLNLSRIDYSLSLKFHL